MSKKADTAQGVANRTDVVIRGGILLDRSGRHRADIAVSGGLIVEIAETISPGSSAKVLDASGCIVSPGFVDLHTHLREPGSEEAEDIESGSRAAALGGYTAVVAMPNTNPAIDSAQVVEYIKHRAKGAMTQVVPSGAITIGRLGMELAPLGEMADLGVTIFTDDGCGVQDPQIMRRAMEYARALGVTIAEHCEDDGLAGGGHMHEGQWSSDLGIAGINVCAEELMAQRDVALARLTGAKLHLLHISSKGTLEILRAAREAGLDVTGEVAPHHLCLADEEVARYDARFKVNPPLRSADHVEALIGALIAGQIDAVATDHAPHPSDAKEMPFDQAPPGMLGLQSALGVVLAVLTSGTGFSPSIGPGAAMDLDAALLRIIETMSTTPAKIASLTHSQGGPLAVGRPANICVVDPDPTWELQIPDLVSRSSNTPYLGRKLKGKVRHTVFNGEPVVLEGVAQR